MLSISGVLLYKLGESRRFIHVDPQLTQREILSLLSIHGLSARFTLSLGRPFVITI